MKVCLVSTYPPQKCGIATYTEALAKHLALQPGLTVSVLSEQGGLEAQEGTVRSLPVFHRSHDWESEILQAARRERAQVVHFQHSPDIFGVDKRLPRLLRTMRAEGIRTVVTLHTVYSRWTGLLERKPLVPEFHRALGEAADRIVVHQVRGMADELERQGVPGKKIAVVAHGTGVPDPTARVLDKTKARAQFGLPAQGPVLLYFGFIHVQKNLHTPLMAMALLQKKMPELRMLVAGSIQYPTWYNVGYMAGVDQMIKGMGLSEKVTSVRRYIPMEDVSALYAASDLVLLPYNQGYGSASGMVHNALAAGVPVLCSSSPKFYEVAESLGQDLVVSTHNPWAWAQRIEQLLASPERNAELKERIRHHTEQTAWATVAGHQHQIYQGL